MSDLKDTFKVIQTALVPGVPDRVEQWTLHAYEDPEGEVYAAYSAEALAKHLCDDSHLFGATHDDDLPDTCYKVESFSELSADDVLANDETGERVIVGEALKAIAERLAQDPTHDPRTAGMVDTIWTYYA